MHPLELKGATSSRQLLKFEAGKKLKGGELHNLYSSPNIITMIKSMIRWAAHVAFKAK
jgi:hypothetical protein